MECSAFTCQLSKFFVVLQILAFWPVWKWFWWRLTVCPNEIWELLPLGVVPLLLSLRKNPYSLSRRDNPILAQRFIAGCTSNREQKVPLVTAESLDSQTSLDQFTSGLCLPAVLTLLYATSYPFLPPLLNAALALTALNATLSAFCLGTRFHLGLWGLMLMSLQILNGLQFYLGFPLRVFVAALVAPLLNISGFPVIREGTCLNWAGEMVLIDAPCSGIKMLWTGLFLSFALACFYNLNWRRTILIALCAMVVVILGNVLRAAALFYVEAKILDMPAWSHTGIGVMVFMIVAVTIALCAEKIGRQSDSVTCHIVSCG